MYSSYFEKIQDEITKEIEDKKGAGGSKGKKSSESQEFLSSLIIEKFSNFIPTHLKLNTSRMIDPSGYSPESVDLIAYKTLFRDIDSIMDGNIPSELVYGTFHLCHSSSQKNLEDILSNVIRAKKINRFTEEEYDTSIIPSFVIAFDSEIKLEELKNAMLDFYLTKHVEKILEFDIFAILNLGVIIKDWRDNRNYIALETGKDTLMWLFILMNEYMDVERGASMEFRNYVKHGKTYTEY